MIWLIEYILFGLGVALVTIGAICDLIAALGLLRFPNFFVRLHAATVGCIGGAVVPLIGISLIALVSNQLGFYRFLVAGIAFVTAIVIMIVSPTGTHALAYATHKSRTVPVEPKVVDMLELRERGEKQ